MAAQFPAKYVASLFLFIGLFGLLWNDYRKSSIKSPQGACFISSPFERGVVGGGLFNLETTMVSVLQKELEYKVEKLEYKKF